MRQSIVFIIFLVLTLQTYSQVAGDYVKLEKPDYCSIGRSGAKSLIGRQAKIWHAGGVYSTLNEGNSFRGLPVEWKRRGGVNGWGSYWPKAGDTGTIVHIFMEKGTARTYLLRIGDNYVPIACSYLTDANSLDCDEQMAQHYLQDSLENVRYAAGCKFKLRNVNQSWSRAGQTNMDKVSESFACGLASKGIDTVMLYKYISDNGSTSIEKAFVLWLDKGKGYVKAFFNNNRYLPTENKATAFDTKPLIDHFFVHRLDTVTTEPPTKMDISHSMGYSIQLQAPSLFFTERIADYIISRDSTHPKAVWWNMISEKLSAISCTLSEAQSLMTKEK